MKFRNQRPRRRRPSLSPSPSPNQQLKNQKPLSVAITGGIGAGKSETLKAFARHGAATISSDAIVHDLIEEDEEVRTALLERFGTTRRSDIAERVFDDREELAWLEALLHPRVSVRYLEWREQQKAPLTVTEVPLLYETGAEERFDKIVVVTAPKALREARREPMPGDRETRLLDDKDKVERADFSYVNTGSLEQLDEFVAEVVRELTGA